MDADYVIAVDVSLGVSLEVSCVAADVSIAVSLNVSSAIADVSETISIVVLIIVAVGCGDVKDPHMTTLHAAVLQQ